MVNKPYQWWFIIVITVMIWWLKEKHIDGIKKKSYPPVSSAPRLSKPRFDVPKIWWQISRLHHETFKYPTKILLRNKTPILQQDHEIIPQLSWFFIGLIFLKKSINPATIITQIS